MTAARELHPLEIKVLLRYGAADAVSNARLAADLGYNTGQSGQALSWLAAKGFVAETARVPRVLYEITDFGRECMEKGTYEQRIADLLESEGALPLPEMARRLGIEAKDVGSAFGGLSKEKVLAMDAEKRAAWRRAGRASLRRGRRRCRRCCEGGRASRLTSQPSALPTGSLPPRRQRSAGPRAASFGSWSARRSPTR